MRRVQRETCQSKPDFLQLAPKPTVQYCPVVVFPFGFMSGIYNWSSLSPLSVFGGLVYYVGAQRGRGAGWGRKGEREREWRLGLTTAARMFSTGLVTHETKQAYHNNWKTRLSLSTMKPLLQSSALEPLQICRSLHCRHSKIETVSAQESMESENSFWIV